MNSKEANRVFCSIELKMAREEAKKAGIKIGRLSTWKDTFGKNFEVFDERGLVWSGRADSAADAKAKYICGLLPETDEGVEE